jgi:hypothetical protein
MSGIAASSAPPHEASAASESLRQQENGLAE